MSLPLHSVSVSSEPQDRDNCLYDKQENIDSDCATYHHINLYYYYAQRPHGLTPGLLLAFCSTNKT